MNLPSLDRRPTLADEVAAELRARIVSGEWGIGDRIPTEPELVAQLGVARNTVREAVRALAYVGMIQIRQGSGTFVVAASELEAVMQRRFADAELEEINEFRSAIESAAARLAATRRTAADLRRIENALQRRDQQWAQGHANAFVETDATFHRAVVAASHNQVFTEIYADLRTVIEQRLAADLGRDVSPANYVDHGELVAAIRDRDAERAAAQAAAHPHSWTRRRRSAPSR